MCQALDVHLELSTVLLVWVTGELKHYCLYELELRAYTVHVEIFAKVLQLYIHVKSTNEWCYKD